VLATRRAAQLTVATPELRAALQAGCL